MKKCPNCKKNVDTKDKFCSFCGEKLESKTSKDVSLKAKSKQKEDKNRKIKVDRKLPAIFPGDIYHIKINFYEIKVNKKQIRSQSTSIIYNKISHQKRIILS